MRSQTLNWRKELQQIIAEHHGMEVQDQDDPDLAATRRREHVQELKRKIESYLQGILPDAFASIREAAKRTLGQRHFDVQLMGGMVLHQGKIAEMRTGEGKTLSSTTAAYLNALPGLGVHLVTVNDYLARRDASWMGQVYDYLGLSVGVIQHDRSFRFEKTAPIPAPGQIEVAAIAQVLDVRNLTACPRQEAYRCDITYGTNNEYGFDYLRDNMAQSLEQKVQRELYYAIVDEVDSILIDEARTPLIISAPDTEPTDQYYQFSKIVAELDPAKDYAVDEKKKSATITEEGIGRVEKMLGVDNIYVERGITTVHHLEQALRARTLYKLDRDYVVREGQIIIVDEFTGRLLPGRRYSEGLHQAIEAKEGVTVQRESKTLATITFQNYFRLYTKIAGMTGTAMTEAEEFQKIYGLDPIVVPTNKPMIRQDMPDLVYKSEKGKHQALVEQVRERHAAGQPVLIGTVSIEKNELISNVLKRAGVPHQVLNAKNHEQEAKIIAQAGRAGAVTLATNIAGRGVDIILGGSPYNETEARKVLGTGGLHVLGTERHESRRIDNQLRGRSGRQGDPGSSQFLVSLEDDLIRLFGGDRVQRLMTSMGIPDDMPIAHGLVSRVIEQAQKKIEGLNFDVRKHVLEFDGVMNKQREVIYRIRNRALSTEADIKEEVLNKIRTEIESLVAQHKSSEAPAEKLIDALQAFFPADRTQVLEKLDSNEAADSIFELSKRVYEEKESRLGPEIMRHIEKLVVLQSIDSLWMEHLDTMEHLRASVRLRGYAQRDPLIEYKREGFDFFQALLAEIDKQIVYTIYKVDLATQPLPSTQQMVTNNTSGGASYPRQSALPAKVGRNDPCPCGSGKKYKKCGLLNTPEHQKLMNGKTNRS
ncbi:MAG: preprotein translocase subunit SecA [Candidatus Doudnabacteria bacterium RIFCSPHIGHO2_01_FULL_50_11]|uniref:Protein translocase subunit SecA n=1 Tax=Candidatus Doudnabacteria bacterium RIFCSPHIGHO2_01_FULL_50_11 TaxID=1817828 RepID=A0A1F5PM58_9BACT|nr:MAG: preprotein translocase subunit SecA [Candidatus Doudnabacteria bacterium RIFCSPHIGHO2_01_FULL_50_11]